MFDFFKFNIDSAKIYKFLYQIKKQSIPVLIFEFLVEVFKINQACSLAIFVPQKCYTKDAQCNIDYSKPKHMCSLMENITCLSAYNTYVLYFNFFTIASFFFLYIIELRRELWLLDHFDYNEIEITNIRDSEKKTNHVLFCKLNYCNKIYFYSYLFVSIIYITNFVSSGVLILLYEFYMDVASVAIFISSFLLCSNKIIYGTYIAYMSYYDNKPISYYSKFNLLYNEIKFEHTHHFAEKLHNFFIQMPYDELSSFFKKNNVNSNIIDELSDNNLIIEIQQNNLIKRSSSKISAIEIDDSKIYRYSINQLDNMKTDSADKIKLDSINLKIPDSIDELNNNLAKNEPENQFTKMNYLKNILNLNSTNNSVDENVSNHKKSSEKSTPEKNKRSSLIIEINQMKNNIIIKTPKYTELIPFNNLTNYITTNDDIENKKSRNNSLTIDDIENKKLRNNSPKSQNNNPTIEKYLNSPFEKNAED